MAGMKRRITFVAVLVVIVAAGLFAIRSMYLTPSFADLNQQMQYLVSDLVEQDESVRNCVLSVVKGDGSFAWAGAVGIARQDGQLPMRKDTPIHIASVTKLYTATAIMWLHEQGALALDDPMSKYLPAALIRGIHVYEGKDYSSLITIQELLSHRSGIADYYSGKPKGGKSLFELFLDEPQRSWTVDETIARARDELTPRFRPGADASYSDTNFQLLGKVIEAVTGKPLHVVFDELFFRPLALDHTWLIGRSEPRLAPVAAAADVFHEDRNITKTRANGAYWADGGIVSTAEEMIVFLKALNEGRIIRADTLKLMHDWHRLRFPLQYGYGTMYFELPGPIRTVMGFPPLWGHSGSTGSFLYYAEDLDLYMAGTINQTASQSKSFVLMLKVMKAVRSNRPAQPSKTAQADRAMAFGR